LISRVQVSERKSPKEYCSWQEVESLTRILANKIVSYRKKYDSILSITNGGIIPARLMARELDINYIQFIQIRNKKLFKEEMPLLNEEKRYLVIDEIYDTGNTFSQVYNAVKTFNCDFAFLISRYKEINSDRIIYVGKILNHNKWIVFPWECKKYY
jgi:uncharacterized protein